MRLDPETLLKAYCNGYFPMPDEASGDIHWYRPDPRATIPLDGFHVSRSLRRKINSQKFHATFSENFSQVMEKCGENRPEGTWINSEFLDAYQILHSLNFAHSLEVWQDGELVGGTYGVSVAGAFFAESMFHTVTDASKFALYALTQRLNERGYVLLECQFMTDHLKSLGALEVSDDEYMRKLERSLQVKPLRFHSSS